MKEYTETGGYSGELFYTFDSFGNTTTLTDIQGNVIVGYLYDLNNGKIVSEYNPYGIDNPYKGDGESGALSITNELTVLDTFEEEMWQIKEEFLLTYFGNTIVSNATPLINSGVSIEIIFEKIKVGEHTLTVWKSGKRTCTYIREHGGLSEEDKKGLKELGLTEKEINNLNEFAKYCCLKSGYGGSKIVGYAGKWETGKFGGMAVCVCSKKENLMFIVRGW